MSDSKIRLLARNVSFLSVGQVASTALGIVLTAVLARGLGPAEFGTLYLVLAIGGFLGVLIDWGQSTYVIREVARGRDDEPGLIGCSLLIRLGMTFCVAAIGAPIALLFGYSEKNALLAVLAIITFLPTALYAPFGFVFRARDRMEIDVLAGLISKVVTLVLTAAVLHFGGGIRDVILMQGVGGVAMLIVGVAFAWMMKIQTGIPTLAQYRELFWYGTPILGLALVTSSHSFIETLLLSTFAGVTTLGWYSASRAICGLAFSPATIALAGFFPELSRAGRSPADMAQMMNMITRLLSFAAAGVASGLHVFAEHGVAIIYGQGRFDETVPILHMTALFIPLWYLAYLLATAMAAVGQNSAMLAISIVRVVICAFMGWLLIGYWQQTYGNGAVILVAIAGAAEIPAVIACLILLPKGAFGLTAMSHVLRCCIAAAATVLFISIFEPLPLFLLVPLYIVTILAAVWVTRLLLPSDVRLFVGMVRNRIGDASAGTDYR